LRADRFSGADWPYDRAVDRGLEEAGRERAEPLRAKAEWFEPRRPTQREADERADFEDRSTPAERRYHDRAARRHFRTFERRMT